MMMCLWLVLDSVVVMGVSLMNCGCVFIIDRIFMDDFFDRGGDCVLVYLCVFVCFGLILM